LSVFHTAFPSLDRLPSLTEPRLFSNKIAFLSPRCPFAPTLEESTAPALSLVSGSSHKRAFSAVLLRGNNEVSRLFTGKAQKERLTN